MGIVLGTTLGGIAFVRGALTPTDTRSGPRKAGDAFTVRVAAGQELAPDEHRDVRVAARSKQTTTMEKSVRVRLPVGESLEPPERHGDFAVYSFPAGCELRSEPVSRWALAQVISLSVLGICLWGTLIGCMLPLFFRQFGIDPALASSAFVATFVDVTGIFIFFSVASSLLL